ncbi:hypothetical protein GT347_14590 [Xylophilus rhododendri]|uniref:Uncharacterized protein n=1 Tax=Xylophilus rhododendri TaxID=2697032 RepID=A0A857J5J9_9BURK|nr:hypothetical protein [Xylophilus rhododendri]QHI99106.1 hypothetical protein GT347_14590 [Xylophilus rhododendri]
MLTIATFSPRAAPVKPGDEKPPPDDEVWYECELGSSEPSEADAEVFQLPAGKPAYRALPPGRPHATPGQLQACQDALQQETERRVDAAAAALILSGVLARIAVKECERGRPLDLAESIALVEDGDVQGFMLAAGLQAGQIDRGRVGQARAAALASLATLPTALLGTSLSSAVNAFFPGNATARLVGFILNVAILALTPWLNACLIQPFGAWADRWRAADYVVRVDRFRIHDRQDKPALTRHIRRAMAEYRRTHAAIARCLEQPGRLARLPDLRWRHARATEALRKLLPAVRAKQAADTRVHLENRFQNLARYPKLVLAPVGQLLRAARWISAWASAALQVGVSLGAAGIQAWLAGRDEGHKQAFTIRFHMLYDPPLNALGDSRLARGSPLRPQDIDETRLRDFFTGPNRSRVAMLATCLRAHAGGYERRHSGAVADAAANLEAGDGCHAELQRLRADLARVESQQLTELALDGVAARLLLPGGRCDPLLWAEVSARLQKQGEVSSQFCKFLGQQWQVGVGPGYYVFVPKLLNLAWQGSPPLPGMVACAGLAALFGLAGYNTHPKVAIERNELQVRIDHGEVGTGFLDTMRQAGVAMVALPRQLQQGRQFGAAVCALLECLGQAAEMERRLGA